MSIEQTLERIAVALEKLADAPTTPAPATSAPAPATPPPGPPAQVPMGGPPVGGPPTQAGAPPVPAGAVPGPSGDRPSMAVLGAAMVDPSAGVPTETSIKAYGAPGPTAPATSPPVATQTFQAPVQGVPTLDDIKALANDFHRAHPEKAADFVEVLSKKNVTKLSDLPPASYPEIHGILKQMMGG